MVLLRALVRAASAAGVDSARLLSELGVGARELDEDRSVPTLLLARAWVLAPELSGDPCFGLHAGARAELGTYDVLDYLFLTSRTLEDACRAVERFHRLLTDIWEVELAVDGGLARFRLRVPPSYVEPLAHAWDYFFSGAMKRVRAVLPDDIVPRAVRLMRPQPADVAEFERVFGVGVEFGAATGEFVFAAEHLAQPLVTSNPELYRVVRRHAEGLLASLDGEEDLLPRARRAVVELLAGESPVTVRALARRLGVGERTLQRQLGERGQSYRELLDDARQELAVRWLEAGTLAVSSVATRLGFGSTSAFSRAFQRWRGVPPTEFRERARAALGEADWRDRSTLRRGR